MARVRKGALGWTSIDVLHREILDGLLPEFGIQGLSEAELDHFNRAWHRLSPWPDVVEGLKRLRARFIIGTLSNGNVSCLGCGRSFFAWTSTVSTTGAGWAIMGMVGRVPFCPGRITMVCTVAFTASGLLAGRVFAVAAMTVTDNFPR